MSNPATSTQQTNDVTNQTGFQSGGTGQSTSGSTANNQVTTNAAGGDIDTLMQSLNSILTGSANFSQSQQPQIQNLSNTLNAANTSNVNTIASRIGGVANPAALIGGENEKNRESGMQTTEALQSGLSAESLQAMLGPLSALTSLIGGNSSTSGGTASSGLNLGSYFGNTAQNGTSSGTAASTPSLFSLLFGL